MNKIVKIITPIFLTIFAIIMCFVGAISAVLIDRNLSQNRNDFSAYTGLASKTVLFIGDGMGENHIKNTEIYYGENMFMNSFNTKGYASTFSNSLLSPTDSAAAASALATGKKFNNKEVSRHNGENITTITELAKQKGYGVGIITTDSLSGATPACFSSHANKRGDEDEIISGQAISDIDLFFGAGIGAYQSNQAKFEENNYTFLTDFSEINTNSDKIIASFSKVVSTDGTNQTPTLEMLTSAAIKFFEKKFPNGYFLMIEGAHIDKRSHDNNILSMMKYLKSFDQSIKIASDTLAQQSSVAIFITADHETGGLSVAANKEAISNSLYTRSGHSSRNVPFYFWLSDVQPINFPTKIDNTDVFKLCKALLDV